MSLKNAAAIADDYFSALLAMGRRAHIERDEYFLVNAKHSRSALAVIDLAVKVFGAKVFVLLYFQNKMYVIFIKYIGIL